MPSGCFHNIMHYYVYIVVVISLKSYEKMWDKHGDLIGKAMFKNGY